jgi:ubiquinone/menaquinone biosynthesis C-methylase UbiE
MNDLYQSDELSKKRWDQAYDISKSPTLWGQPMVPFIDKAIDMFKLTECSNILDIPCGDGRNILPFAKLFNMIFAVDASTNALQIANKELDIKGIRNCALMKVDIFDAPFFDKQIDGVFCCDLLGHLTKPVKALNELLRICKPGGYIVSNVFALGDSTRGDKMSPLGNEEYLYDNRFYFKFYSEEQVLSLINQLDCKLISLELFRWMEPPHEGYREYPHEHESWVFALQKKG